jgi:hypothetical protein
MTDDDNDFLARLTFKSAKTMPEIPHFYVVRTPDNEADFVALFHTIRQNGVEEKFFRRTYRYWYAGDGFKYWAMTDDLSESQIINRAKVEADDPELSLKDSF